MPGFDNRGELRAGAGSHRVGLGATRGVQAELDPDCGLGFV